MAKKSTFTFEPAAWILDPVSTCSLAAQGLWLRMMLMAHGTDRYGYLSQNGVALPPENISRGCGTSLEQYNILLAELDRAGVPSRTPEGVIFSRRMVRDAKKRLAAQKYGALGGNPTLNGGVNPTLNAPDNPPDNLQHTVLNKSGDGEGGKGGAGERAGAEGVEFGSLIPDTLTCRPFVAAWADFCKHRRQIRHRMTQMAAARILKKLEAAGLEASLWAIDMSISHDWQGVFPERFPGMKPTNGKSKLDHQSEVLERAMREGRHQ